MGLDRLGFPPSRLDGLDELGSLLFLLKGGNV